MKNKKINHLTYSELCALLTKYKKAQDFNALKAEYQKRILSGTK